MGVVGVVLFAEMLTEGQAQYWRGEGERGGRYVMEGHKVWEGVFKIARGWLLCHHGFVNSQLIGFHQSSQCTYPKPQTVC
jgi:uncharacterized membrane protein